MDVAVVRWYSWDMQITTKQVTEFGQAVTLYRATTDDGRKGTLWHSSEAKAVGHFERKGWT